MYQFSGGHSRPNKEPDEQGRRVLECADGSTAHESAGSAQRNFRTGKPPDGVTVWPPSFLFALHKRQPVSITLLKTTPQPEDMDGGETAEQI